MALVGLVVVSHSRALAEAAVELALQMVHGERPPIVIAAGMPDGSLGTDAMEVMAGIQQASAGAGVVVLVDLGSAIMSAEMALEFLDDEATDVRLVPAPFVEGLLAAAVLAAGGASLDEVATEASGALRPKLTALGAEDAAPSPAPGGEQGWEPEVQDQAILPNAMGLHARPVALIAAAVAGLDAEVRVITDRGSASAASSIGMATLAARHGETVRVEGRGSAAAHAVEAVMALVRDGFGEPGPSDAPAAANPTVTPPTGQALGVSPGRVVGEARRMVEPMVTAPDMTRLPQGAEAAEAQRLREAIDAVVAEYRARAEDADPQAAEILSATATLAADPTLADSAIELVRDTRLRLPAPAAFWEAANEAAALFAGAGPLMAERVTDIRDIRDRVVSRLIGVAMPGIPDPGHPFILVARDLAPSDTATLDARHCLGIVTAEGGPTSHTSILARSMGIPAVVGAATALEITDGTRVLVDGSTGEVIMSPTDEQLGDARTAPAELVPLAGPGRTHDGAAVALLGNIGSVRGAATAAGAGAEGIGLFRTEFAFLDRADEPDVDEQVELYRGVLGPFAGTKVVFRTLDAGSDKPMPFLSIDGEPNPALGVRGYRTAGTHPGVLSRQLQAITTASQGSAAEVWVMAPMISTPQEAAEFAALARGAGVRTVGVMVETPSAALQAAEIFEHVDFISVGTNDLTQYTMAADRQGTALGALQDSWQPAVLRLLRTIGDAATAAGKPAGVCGEAASDPALAPVLAGLGFSSLSMGPMALNEVGTALAAVTLEQCRAAARAACDASGPAAARHAAAELLRGGTAG